MYYNPYCYYWGMYPKAPAACYPMGDAVKHLYNAEKCVSNEQRELLKKIMEVEFSLIELNLYLDTHPKDKDAIKLCNEYVEKLEDLKEKYTRKYGPISPVEESDCPWEYVQGPWPWEI